jgi:hypothetical protein
MPDFENQPGVGVISPQDASFVEGLSSSKSQARMNRCLAPGSNSISNEGLSSGHSSVFLKKPRTANHSNSTKRSSKHVAIYQNLNIAGDETDSEKFNKGAKMFGLSQWHEKSFLFSML